jgi:hypothetical protein
MKQSRKCGNDDPKGSWAETDVEDTLKLYLINLTSSESVIINEYHAIS